MKNLMSNKFKILLFLFVPVMPTFAMQMQMQIKVIDQCLNGFESSSAQKLLDLSIIKELSHQNNLVLDNIRWANDRDLDNDRIEEVENEPQFKHIPISSNQYYLRGMRISHLLGEKEGINWLDLGAGQAKQLFTALDLFSSLKVTGIAKHIPKNYKVIQEKIETCKGRFRYFATPQGFELLDEPNLEILGKQSFDLITDYLGAIHYSLNPQASICKSLELLKEGGKLIIAPFQIDLNKGCSREYKEHPDLFQRLSENSAYEVNYYPEDWYIIITKKIIN